LSYRHSFLLKRMGVRSILTSHYGHLHSLSDSLTSDLFTIDFWINLSSGIAGSNAICSMGVNSSSYYSLQFNSSTSFGLECYDNQGQGGGVSNPFFTISALSTGQWYHMALIKGWGGDPTKVALTINGVASATVNTWNSNFYTPTTPNRRVLS
jgi:hypothetical protein